MITFWIKKHFEYKNILDTLEYNIYLLPKAILHVLDGRQT